MIAQYKLETINGKTFLRMTFTFKDGSVQEDLARVYDLKGKPYIRRMSEKLAVQGDVLKGKTVVFEI